MKRQLAIILVFTVSLFGAVTPVKAFTPHPDCTAVQQPTPEVTDCSDQRKKYNRLHGQYLEEMETIRQYEEGAEEAWQCGVGQAIDLVNPLPSVEGFIKDTSFWGLTSALGKFMTKKAASAVGKSVELTLTSLETAAALCNIQGSGTLSAIARNAKIRAAELKPDVDDAFVELSDCLDLRADQLFEKQTIDELNSYAIPKYPANHPLCSEKEAQRLIDQELLDEFCEWYPQDPRCESYGNIIDGGSGKDDGKGSPKGEAPSKTDLDGEAKDSDRVSLKNASTTSIARTFTVEETQGAIQLLEQHAAGCQQMVTQFKGDGSKIKESDASFVSQCNHAMRNSYNGLNAQVGRLNGKSTAPEEMMTLRGLKERLNAVSDIRTQLEEALKAK